MKQTVTEILAEALARAKDRGELKLEVQPSIVLETPKAKEHGDLSATLALSLSKHEAKPPRDVANIIIQNIQDRDGILERTEIAGPGFINFFLNQDRWSQTLFDIESEGSRYGFPDVGKEKKILLEYVSANPTGPLHVGHGRGAAVGDALANLLAAVGYAIEREFYINDAGRQIRNLALSIYTRYQQALGNDVPFPEDGYQGTYIEAIANGLVSGEGKKYLNVPFEQCEAYFAEYGRHALLNEIRSDLDAFGVTFDTWFSETTLLAEGAVQKSIDELKERGYAFEQDGA